MHFVWLNMVECPFLISLRNKGEKNERDYLPSL